jgi:NAD(P)-dependent dehydrogenase (short-subunit alcohol dehydrogenase family)
MCGTAVRVGWPQFDRSYKQSANPQKKMLLYLTLIAVAALFAWYKYTSRPIMTMNPKNKVVVVTGAAGGNIKFFSDLKTGLGSDLTRRLIKMGAKVIACDISIDHLKKNLPDDPNIAFFELDVTKPDQIAECVKFTGECLQKWNQKHLFGLVNNAGIARTREQKYVAPMVELDDNEMLGVFGVNIFGVIRCTNAFYPLMSQNFVKQEKESSIIVNIASLAGLFAGPFFNYYTATKFAVVGYSDSLRRELKHSGVRVSAIEPGFTDTNIVNSPPHNSSSPFAEIVRNGLQKAKERMIHPMQHPSKVTDAIVSCLFASNETTPAHIIVSFQSSQFNCYRLSNGARESSFSLLLICHTNG